jgi:hypothetical protein
MSNLPNGHTDSVGLRCGGKGCRQAALPKVNLRPTYDVCKEIQKHIVRRVLVVGQKPSQMARLWAAILRQTAARTDQNEFN